MKCNEALPLIHEYLDGGLASENKVLLRMHLRECGDCAARLRQLEQTEALVRAFERPEAPPDLTAKIMSSLPPASSEHRSFVRWLRRHPAMTAAAAFLIIMISSFLSLWNQGSQLVVRGDDLDGLMVKDGLVIVPSGKTMEGDLIVENGTVQVDGDVKGNVTVIDGKIALASTAHISGRITKVDQAIDWIWFKIGEWFGVVVPAPQT